MRAVDTYMRGMITRGYASPVRHPDSDDDYVNSFSRRRNEIARPLSSVIGKRAQKRFDPLYTKYEGVAKEIAELREEKEARTRAEREEDVRSWHRQVAKEREEARLKREAREEEERKRFAYWHESYRRPNGWCIVCLGPIHNDACVRPSYACTTTGREELK